MINDGGRPFVFIKESASISRFWSIVDSIFFWDFLITLDYEWSVLRGRRPYRWTIWLYSLTRVATLASVVINMYRIGSNPANCQVTISLWFIFAYLAFATSSLLILLRVIAVWDRKKIIVAFATSVWGINIAFLVQGVARLRSSWEANVVQNNVMLVGCVLYLDSIRLSTIVAFAADTILLLIMLLGLYRLRRRGHSLMTLGRLLWNQGVFWLLLVIAAELTPTVLIILNLDQESDMAFQVPWVVAMSIAATRMYRSLSDFLTSDVSPNVPSTRGPNAFKSNGDSAAPVVLAGVQVSVHTTHDSEQRYAPLANCFGSNISEKPYGEPHEVIVGNVEK